MPDFTKALPRLSLEEIEEALIEAEREALRDHTMRTWERVQDLRAKFKLACFDGCETPAANPTDRLAQIEREVQYFRSFEKRGLVFIPSSLTATRLRLLALETRALRVAVPITQGQKKGGQAQAARAMAENAPVITAYRAWRERHEDRKRYPKAAFIRQWRGPPCRGERQLYCILIAEP